MLLINKWRHKGSEYCSVLLERCSVNRLGADTVKPSHRAWAYLATSVVLCLLCLFWPDTSASADEKAVEGQQSTPYASDELLVTYATDPDSFSADDEARQEVGAKVQDEIDSLDAQILTFPKIEEERSEQKQDRALESKKTELEQDPRVESVDYNYRRESLSVPDDPQFSRQWGLKKARFPKAWDKTARKDVEIAILDGGADTRHPDLKTKVGLQKDFVDEDRIAEDASFGHGTHVAGIAAAATNDGKGIAGGCLDCRLMIVSAHDRQSV